MNIVYHFLIRTQTFLVFNLPFDELVFCSDQWLSWISPMFVGLNSTTIPKTIYPVAIFMFSGFLLICVASLTFGFVHFPPSLLSAGSCSSTWHFERTDIAVTSSLLPYCWNGLVSPVPELYVESSLLYAFYQFHFTSLSLKILTTYMYLYLIDNG